VRNEGRRGTYRRWRRRNGSRCYLPTAAAAAALRRLIPIFSASIASIVEMMLGWIEMFDTSMRGETQERDEDTKPNRKKK
jgi:hypothetical protein